MKSFTELRESKKLTKTEETFLSKFVNDSRQTIKVTYYRGTGQIRGGGSPEGKRDYDLAHKLVKKGILKIVKKDNSTYHHNVYVKLSNPNMPIDIKLSAFQTKTMYAIKHLITSVNKGADFDRIKYKSLTTKQWESLDDLQKLGLIKYSFDHIELTDKGITIVGKP